MDDRPWILYVLFFCWKWIPAPKIVKPSFARSSKGKRREGNSVFSNYPIWFDFWFDPTVRRNLLCWRNLIEFFPWYSISFYSPENKKWTQNYSCSIFWVKFRTSSTALLASDTSLQALAMLASKPSCVARPGIGATLPSKNGSWRPLLPECLVRKRSWTPILAGQCCSDARW